jgi:hypothetical protein
MLGAYNLVQVDRNAAEFGLSGLKIARNNRPVQIRDGFAVPAEIGRSGSEMGAAIVPLPWFPARGMGACPHLLPTRFVVDAF